MTAPRRIVPNAQYLLTRRCSEKRFFLRPSKAVNETVEYVLAIAAARYGVMVHAFCVLSNHVHIVVTDVAGNLPAFQQYLHSLLARSINALLGRWESFWAPGSYSAVALPSPEDVLAKCAYVLANPVSAGLVRKGSDWPGVRSAPERIGAGPVSAKRPGRFFRAKGEMPETAALQLVCPPGFASADDFRRRLAAEVASLEGEAAGKVGSKGHSFLGVSRILAQSPHHHPGPREPRRELNPRVAGRDKWKRIEAISRLKSFLADYRVAWLAFTRGLRQTVFPHGTYWMRVTYGVRCAAPG